MFVVFNADAIRLLEAAMMHLGSNGAWAKSAHVATDLFEDPMTKKIGAGHQCESQLSDAEQALCDALALVSSSSPSALLLASLDQVRQACIFRFKLNMIVLQSF